MIIIKRCIKCGKTYPPTDKYFYKRPEGGIRNECKKCHTKKTSQWTQAWRKRTKVKIVEYLGGKCCICGYDKCYAALDCHHTRGKKESHIANMLACCTAWEKIKKELDKCVLVCRNCHAEIHHKDLYKDDG